MLVLAQEQEVLAELVLGEGGRAAAQFNQSVERTGMSRAAQCQFRRQRRLIPVAHLWRWATFRLRYA